MITKQPFSSRALHTSLQIESQVSVPGLKSSLNDKSTAGSFGSFWEAIIVEREGWILHESTDAESVGPERLL